MILVKKIDFPFQKFIEKAAETSETQETQENKEEQETQESQENIENIEWKVKAMKLFHSSNMSFCSMVEVLLEWRGVEIIFCISVWWLLRTIRPDLA